MIAAEERGGDAAVPCGGIEAEGAGEFGGAETGGDAHTGVVARDVVGTEEGRDDGEEQLEDAVARGLAGDDEARGGAKPGAEGGKFGRGEVVKDEIAEDDGVVGVGGEPGEIGAMPRAVGGPIGGDGATVEGVGGEAASLEGAGEFAGAGAEFEDAFAGADERRERAGEPAEVAHGKVDQAKIATAAEGGGVVGRERVEELGLERAEHRERKVARRGRGVQCAAQFHA